MTTGLTQYINFSFSVEQFLYSFADWLITAHIHLLDNQCVSKIFLSFFLQLSFLRQISHGGVNLKAFLSIFSEKHSSSESYAARTTGDENDLGSHGQSARNMFGTTLISFIYIYLLIFFFWGGGRGGEGWEEIQKGYIRERRRLEVQILTLLCTIFDRKGNSFIYLP